MKNLYIVGAGGFGREILNYIQDYQAMGGPSWNIRGFLADTENPLGARHCDYGVAGGIQDFMPAKGDVLVMGIADPAAKKRLGSILKNRGATFETIIFPGAYVGRHCQLGEGCLLYAGSALTVNVELGPLCSLLGSGIGHDAKVGPYCTLSAFTHIMGRVEIGEEAFVGANAAIGPNLKIGPRAYVCMGSMVMKNVPAEARVMGNPAREIG